MNQKIRWGILGTAHIAKTALIPAIKLSSNGTVAAIASRSLESAQKCAAEYGIPKAHGSYEALVNDPEIDAIYIPLPNGLHCEWSLRCADAGKPVLCEKPLAGNTADGQKMVTAFKAKNLLLAEAFMYRFHPLTCKVVELVRSGVIGQVDVLRSTFMAPISKPGDIRFQADLAGGGMRDLGCYCVSVMRLITGEEPNRIEAVGTVQNAVDTNCAGVLGFPSGAVGYFGCSMVSHFDASYEVFGSKGRLRVDEGGMVAWPGGNFKIQLWTKDGFSEIAIPAANHYQLMAEDFADSLLNHRKPAFAIEDSLKNLAVIDSVLAKLGAR